MSPLQVNRLNLRGQNPKEKRCNEREGCGGFLSCTRSHSLRETLEKGGQRQGDDNNESGYGIKEAFSSFTMMSRYERSVWEWVCQSVDAGSELFSHLTLNKVSLSVIYLDEII